MSMDRIRQVAGCGSHFDRQHGFGDHLARAGADDADSNNALLDGLDNELGNAFGARQRLSST